MKTDTRTLRERLYLVLIISLLIMMMGMTANYQAIKYNEGKMPVYLYEDSWVLDDNHIFFKDFSEVNYPYLSDIFKIKNRIISIGDILMISSIAFYLSGLGVTIIREVRNKKKDKHKRNKEFPYKRRALRKQKKDE